MRTAIAAAHRRREVNWDFISIMALDVALWMFVAALIWSLTIR